MTRRLLLACLLPILFHCRPVWDLLGSSLPITDSEAVLKTIDKLAITYAPGDSDIHVTRNLELPITGKYETTISWNSSSPNCITTNGTVTRSIHSNMIVGLTATVKKGMFSRPAKPFILNVMMDFDKKAVLEAKAALAIGYSGDDNSNRVITHVSLPTLGLHDVSITWRSSSTNYHRHKRKRRLSSNGRV